MKLTKLLRRPCFWGAVWVLLVAIALLDPLGLFPPPLEEEVTALTVGAAAPVAPVATERPTEMVAPTATPVPTATPTPPPTPAPSPTPTPEAACPKGAAVPAGDWMWVQVQGSGFVQSQSFRFGPGVSLTGKMVSTVISTVNGIFCETTQVGGQGKPVYWRKGGER